MDLTHYSKGDYDPGPLWKRVAWYVVSWLLFETLIPWPSEWKAAVLRAFGAEIGDEVVIKPNVKIKYPWFLSAGENAWIGEQVWIDNPAKVTIGDHAVLSQGACLFTGNHDYKSQSFDLRLGEIHVGHGAWIAAKSIVCPGVTVGRLAVLTVGSVATGSLDENAVYTGNPAARVRSRGGDNGRRHRE